MTHLPYSITRQLPRRPAPTGHSTALLLAGAFCAFGVGMVAGAWM